MAKAITVDPNEVVTVKVVGSKPKHRPYIRLGYTRPDGYEPAHSYIGSICNANAMRGLANQILRALDGE